VQTIDLIEVASQSRLMRTFALQPGYAHPYVMEGERPREPQTVARTFLSVLACSVDYGCQGLHTAVCNHGS
jgi:hypothetical protein